MCSRYVVGVQIVVTEGTGLPSNFAGANIRFLTKRANEHSTELPEAIDLLLKDQAGYCYPENDRDARKARRIVQDTAQSDPVLIVEEDFEDMFSDYNLGLIASWTKRSQDTSPC